MKELVLFLSLVAINSSVFADPIAFNDWEGRVSTTKHLQARSEGSYNPASGILSMTFTVSNGVRNSHDFHRVCAVTKLKNANNEILAEVKDTCLGVPAPSLPSFKTKSRSAHITVNFPSGEMTVTSVENSFYLRDNGRGHIGGIIAATKEAIRNAKITIGF